MRNPNPLLLVGTHHPFPASTLPPSRPPLPRPPAPPCAPPPGPSPPKPTQVLLLPPSCAQPGAPTQLSDAWRCGTGEAAAAAKAKAMAAGEAAANAEAEAEAEAVEAAGAAAEEEAAAEVAAAEEAEAAAGLSEFPFAPSAALLRRVAAAGGYLFRLRPIRNRIRSETRSETRSGGGQAAGMNGCGGGEEAEAAEAAEAAEGRCLALFLPPGWLHWLVGDGAARPTAAVLGSGAAAQTPQPHGGHGWHALFGGSFFPDCHVARGRTMLHTLTQAAPAARLVIHVRATSETTFI